MDIGDRVYTQIDLSSINGLEDVPAGTLVQLKRLFPSGWKLSAGGEFKDDTWEANVCGKTTVIRTQEQHLGVVAPERNTDATQDATGATTPF